MNSRRIYLVGFMGAGKSTVGKILAAKLNCPLYDTDEEIENRVGKSIADIFEEEGEEAFRNYETNVLRDLSRKDPPMVIATGGGLPIRAENRNLMNQTGLPVLLRVDPDTAMERVGEDPERPLFQDENQVRMLFTKREPDYENITTTFDTRDATPQQIAQKINEKIENS